MGIQVTSAGTESYPIATSSTTYTHQPATLRKFLQMSDGTIHDFIQAGTVNSNCGGISKNGLLWMYSTDSGQTWICGGQLSSDTTNLFHASVTKDSQDNIYVVYSQLVAGAGTGKSVYYRKLTKGAGSTWTLEAEQLIAPLTGTAGIGYSYASLELDSASRLWVASRYFDGVNYQVSVAYSDDSSIAPSWTISEQIVYTGSTNAQHHIPSVVYFNQKIGVIYSIDNISPLRWIFRRDSDPEVYWSSPISIIGPSNSTYAQFYFSAVGDALGRIHIAYYYSTKLYYIHYNGSSWLTPQIIDTAAAYAWNNVSITTDDTSVWVAYFKNTGYSNGLYGYNRIVYKKGVFPFNVENFDLTSTDFVANHGFFSKYWSYMASSYLDDTSDAVSTTTADTQMLGTTGDIIYFGKTIEYDGISWDVSTASASGTVVWEFWDGDSWEVFSFLTSSNTRFQGDGWISFTPPVDWTATNINGESDPYYYIRARLTANFTTVPVGVQFSSFIGMHSICLPAHISGNVLPGIRAEGPNPVRTQYSSVPIATSPFVNSQADEISNVITYGSSYDMIYGSNMTSMVRTSDGTMHAFIYSGHQPALGNIPSIEIRTGLNWFTSNDNGVTWVGRGSMATFEDNTSKYVNVIKDDNDNLYLFYQLNTYDIYYRKFSKTSGSNWTVGPASLIQDGVASMGYYQSVVVIENYDRIWLAIKLYMPTPPTYAVQINIYYSDGFSETPTWTLSQSGIDATAATARALPSLIRYGNKIGLLYKSRTRNGAMQFRYRTDGDDLTIWSSDEVVSDYNRDGDYFQAIYNPADGIIYVAAGCPYEIRLFTYDGSKWRNYVVANNILTGYSGTIPVSIVLSGQDIWIVYTDVHDLTVDLPGRRRLVYKYGKTTDLNNFDSFPTEIAPYEKLFGQVWVFRDSSYSDETVKTSSRDEADISLPSRVGEMIYLGSDQKFNTITWDISTNGVGGNLVWEYWNGSSWQFLNKVTGASKTTFGGNGYLEFVPNSDWAKTSVNSESSQNYYIRARVIVDFTTSAVGTQMDSIPHIMWVEFLPEPVNENLYGMWVEGNGNTSKVVFSSFPAYLDLGNTSSYSEIEPNVFGRAYASNPGSPYTSPIIVNSSNGYMHAFISNVRYPTVCGDIEAMGLFWYVSTDGGNNWTCKAAINTAMASMAYPTAVIDSQDNIYVVFTPEGSVNFRKLTYTGNSEWIVGPERVLSFESSSYGYPSYPSVTLEGSTRLWLAMINKDGTNYWISVYYSSDLSDNPTFIRSQANISENTTISNAVAPIITRLGNKIGVIYKDTSARLVWRLRSDSDDLAIWGPEEVIATIPELTTSKVLPAQAVADGNGNLHYVAIINGNIYYLYFNGTAWQELVKISSTASNGTPTISLKDTFVYIAYASSNGFSAGNPGRFVPVYVKGKYPFTASDFSTSEFKIYSRYRVFDKVWSFTGGAYSDQTGVASNTDVNDVQMVSMIGDSMYFGLTEKFDSISWDIATQTANGTVIWQYWNGSNWVELNHVNGFVRDDLNASGRISFAPNNDWQMTKVNSDSISYYYVRALVNSNYHNPPVGTQFSAFSSLSKLIAPSGVYNSGLIGGIFAEASSNSTTYYKLRSLQIPLPLVPTDLKVNGNNSDIFYSNDTTPQFDFNISDYLGKNQLGYEIQISTVSDFSSLVLDYVSELGTQGDRTFSLDTSSSGTYNAGSLETKLDDGQYFWRVKTVSQTGDDSEYTSVIKQIIIDNQQPDYVRITDLGLISEIPNQPYLVYYLTSQTPYIKGLAELNSTVVFKYGLQEYSTVAGSDGIFRISITNPELPRTNVVLKYYTIDKAGNKSVERTLVLIIGIENFPSEIKGNLFNETQKISTTTSLTKKIDNTNVTSTPILSQFVSYKVEDISGKSLINAKVIIDNQEYITDDKGQIYLEGRPLVTTNIEVEYDGKNFTGNVLGTTIRVDTKVNEYFSNCKCIITIIVLILILIILYIVYRKLKHKTQDDKRKTINE